MQADKHISSSHPGTRPERHQSGFGQHGFSLMELLIVVAIILIVAAFEIPLVIGSVRAGRLRGAATDCAGLLQTARIRAVDDDRYYAVYTEIAQKVGTNDLPQMAYVDINPISANGTTWGTGAAGLYTAPDPMIQLSSDIVVPPPARAAAPNPTDLETKFCTSCGGWAAGIIQNSAPMFGPEGLPCRTTASGAGTVCNTAGGATAYEVFLQSAVTQQWAAVTVTPAGRIKTWYYDSSAGTWSPTQ